MLFAVYDVYLLGAVKALKHCMSSFPLLETCHWFGLVPDLFSIRQKSNLHLKENTFLGGGTWMKGDINTFRL